jgi:hypothetical protein
MPADCHVEDPWQSGEKQLKTTLLGHSVTSMLIVGRVFCVASLIFLFGFPLELHAADYFGVLISTMCMNAK